MSKRVIGPVLFVLFFLYVSGLETSLIPYFLTYAEKFNRATSSVTPVTQVSSHRIILQFWYVDCHEALFTCLATAIIAVFTYYVAKAKQFQHELSTTEHGAISALNGRDDLIDTVIIFENRFERAGVKHYVSRIRWARRALASYNKLMFELDGIEPIIEIPSEYSQIA